MARDEGHSGHLAVSEGNGSSGGVDGLLAELKLMLGSMADAAAKPVSPRVPWEGAHPVPILGAVPISGGAGTNALNANLYGPGTPYHWDLRRLSCWGFSAGTVTVYLNNASGEQIAVFPSAGQTTWSSQVLLTPGDRLVFVAAGITGSVFFGGQAIEVRSEWLPDYLM
jgi:hypothetical protein